MLENNFGFIDFNIKVYEPSEFEFKKMQLLFGCERPIVKIELASERTESFRAKLRDVVRLYREKKCAPQRLKTQFRNHIINLSNHTAEDKYLFEKMGTSSEKLSRVGVLLEGFEGFDEETETFQEEILEEIDNHIFESKLPEEKPKREVLKKPNEISEKRISERIPKKSTEPNKNSSGFNQEFYDFCLTLE